MLGSPIETLERHSHFLLKNAVMGPPKILPWADYFFCGLVVVVQVLGRCLSMMGVWCPQCQLRYVVSYPLYHEYVVDEPFAV